MSKEITYLEYICIAGQTKHYVMKEHTVVSRFILTCYIKQAFIDTILCIFIYM